MWTRKRQKSKSVSTSSSRTINELEYAPNFLKALGLYNNVLAFIMYLCFLNITHLQPKFSLYSKGLGFLFGHLVPWKSFVLFILWNEDAQCRLWNKRLSDVQAWPSLITDWLEKLAPQGTFQSHYSWGQRAFIVEVSEMKSLVKQIFWVPTLCPELQIKTLFPQDI